MKRHLPQTILVALISLTILLAHKVTYGEDRTSQTAPLLANQPTTIAGNDFWTWRGPQYNVANLEGPQVTQIAIDPINPNIVYAGTNQGVYRSNNGGETWQMKNEGLGGYGDLVITGIAIDPTNPSCIIIGTWGAGVWQSTNSGDSWTRLPDPLAFSQNRHAQFSDAEMPPPPEIAGFGPSATYQGEETFLRPEGLPITWNRTAIRRVTLNPANPNEIFASVDDGHGLYRSGDGGNSWEKMDLGFGSSRTFTFAPSNNQIRYASFGSWSSSGGFFRTTNGGAVWTEVGAGTIGGSVTAVSIHPTNPNIVLAGTAYDGLYRSSDGGSSWQKVSNGLPDTTYYSVKFAPSNPNIAYAGGNTWVYVSQDGGLNWSVADNSFPALYLEGLAVHPTQAETILVGSNNSDYGGVYKRTSLDSNFVFKSSGMEDTIVLDVEQDPNQPSRLFVATWGAGFFRSTNGGLTWTRVWQLPYVYDIEAVADGVNTVLYATTFYSDWGIFKSTDRGDTWYQVSWDYPSYITFDIESIYDNPNRLVAATYSGVQYSYDGGVNWYDALGLGTDKGIILRICEFPGTGRLLAATFGGGVFYSWGGSSWYEANTGLLTQAYSGYTYDVACSEDVSGLAYVAGLGISKTTDYGEHWSPIGTNLPNDYFTGIDIVPDTGDVFASSRDRGVFYSAEGLPLWRSLNTGLLEERTRSVDVVGASPTKVMVGTNGLGVWEYTMVNQPSTTVTYLPLVLNNPPPLPTCYTYESNDSFDQAFSIPRPGTYCSFIGSDEDDDYFSFNVSTLAPVTLALTNIPVGNDYELVLYDPNRNLITGSYRSSNQSEEINFQPSRTGRYYVHVYSFRGSNPGHGYHLGLAYDGAIGSGVISGTIFYQSSTVSDAGLRLYYWNGYRSKTISTVTNSSGGYGFRDMASLPIGHYYYVNYLNQGGSQYLSSWYCDLITSYTYGQNISTCSPDISNVFAATPYSGDVVQLPTTFTWNRRYVWGDNYRLRLRSADYSVYWLSPYLGDVDNYTLSSLPSGFSYNETYRWDVLVYNSGGIGYPYYYREVVFSPTVTYHSFNPTPGFPNDTNLLQLLPALDPLHPIAAAPAQK